MAFVFRLLQSALTFGYKAKKLTQQNISVATKKTKAIFLLIRKRCQIFTISVHLQVDVVKY